MKGHVVSIRGKSESNIHGNPCEVRILDIENGSFDSLWKNEIRCMDDLPDIKFYEFPTAALLTEQSLYLGLNTGVIKKIELATKDAHSIDRLDVNPDYKLWDLYGSKREYEEYQDYIKRVKELAEKNPELRERLKESKRYPNFFDLDKIVCGFHNITGIVEHEGKVYDGGSTGLFETDTGKKLTGEHVSSLTVYDGRLCYVPTSTGFLTRLEQGTGFKMSKNGGSLVDAITQETIIHLLTPFDGSGCKQGEYCICGDTAFVHHGDYPGERITRRKIKDGTEVSYFSVKTSNGFVNHKRKVYDLREGHWEGTALIQSDIEDNSGKASKALFKTENYISVASGGDLGLLISEYDPDRNKSRIFSLDNKSIKIVKEGRVDFLNN
jgi:hypothetical protein